jgi:hypothetical protein
MVTTPPGTAGNRVSSAIRDTARAMTDPTMFVWAMYVLLVPVYVIKSGLPQPGDWLILILVPLALARVNGALDASQRPSLRLLRWFLIYVALINVAWSAALGWWSFSGKHGFLLTPIIYIYNALIFWAVLMIHRRHGSQFLWFTGRLTLLSILSQVALAVLSINNATNRAELGFNNPNQLGYFALLAASILMVLHRRKYLSTIEVAIGLIGSSYLCLISASKAALGSIAILAIVGLIVRFRTMLFVSALFALTVLVANPVSEAIDNAVQRFENDQSYGFLEERGYDRIWDNPEYWVTGAGEGGLKRFEQDEAVIGDHEIHSSFGAVFFGYGILGLVLLCAFLYAVVRRTEPRMWLLLAPTMAYGVTHQGLRFTPFWVLLALVVVLRTDDLRARRGLRASARRN